MSRANIQLLLLQVFWLCILRLVLQPQLTQLSLGWASILIKENPSTLYINAITRLQLDADSQQHCLWSKNTDFLPSKSVPTTGSLRIHRERCAGTMREAAGVQIKDCQSSKQNCCWAYCHNLVILSNKQVLNISASFSPAAKKSCCPSSQENLWVICG